MYRFMDAEELEINQIDNLKMIHIYDLAGVSGGATSAGTESTSTMKRQDKTKHITAMAVYYEDNKQKNLCVMDKHYNLLVERVLDLYSRCEEKSSIMMDPDTKKLIEQAFKGVGEGVSPITKLGKKYSGMQGEDFPRYNKEAYIRVTTMPMVKYYLTELYSMLDMNIEFKDTEIGWHGNTVLLGIIGREEKKLPIKYSFESSTRFNIVVGNFLKDKCSITFNVNYKQQSMEVSFNSEDAGIVGESTFTFGDNSSISKTNIKVNDVTVYYKDMPVEEVSGDVLNKDYYKEFLDIDLANSKVYVLPWQTYHFCKMNTLEDGSIERTDLDTGYIDSNNDIVFVRQYAWSFISNQETGLSIKTGGVMMERLVPDTKQTLLQTTFLPVGYYSGWDYKNKLENKYFYDEIKEK